MWAKPLGLLYLLEELRTRGNSVALIDCVHEGREKPLPYGRFRIARESVPKPAPYRNIPRRYWKYGMSEAAFRSRLASLSQHDAVLLTSGMTYWHPGVAWCLAILREVLPGVPVLLGGVYARLCPEHAASLGADFVQTAFRPVAASRPAFDLYDGLGYAVTATSWGCPLRCGYCASSRLWPSFVLRPHDEVEREISFELSLSGVNDIAFYDDALLVGREARFLPLASRLERFDGARFHTPNGLHVREIDAACARALRRARFVTLRLSLESVDPGIGHSGSDKVSRDQYARAVANLLEAGYEPERLETYLLVGLPGQTPESVADAIAFVRSQGAVPKLAEFSPLPGTRMFADACARSPEIASEPLLQNNTAWAPYIGRTIDPGVLQDLKDFAKGRRGAARVPASGGEDGTPPDASPSDRCLSSADSRADRPPE